MSNGVKRTNFKLFSALHLQIQKILHFIAGTVPSYNSSFSLVKAFGVNQKY